MGDIRTFADLVAAEDVGWEDATQSELRRMRELAADDRPTLRNRFTDAYRVDEKSSAWPIKQFLHFESVTKAGLRNSKRQMSNHRMIVVQGLLQATAARALDLELASRIATGIKSVVKEMPSLGEIVSSSGIPIESLRTYLLRIPKVETPKGFTGEGGWPGFGASEDKDGQVRLMLPLKWLEPPLNRLLRRASTYTSLGAARDLDQDDRNPYLVASAVVERFRNLWTLYYDEISDESKSAVKAALPGFSASASSYRTRHSFPNAVLALGLLQGVSVPVRSLVRLGASGIRKAPGDLEAALEFYRQFKSKNSSTLGYVPDKTHLPVGMFNGAEHKAAIKAAYDAFDSVDAVISVAPRSMERSLAGDSLDREGANWSVEATVSAGIRIPRQLTAYICQSSEVDLKAVASWAQDAYEWSFDKAPAPGPQPKTTEQVRKLSGVVKPVKATNDRDLAVDQAGAPRYLPETQLTELEATDDRDRDINSLMVGDTSVYNPHLVDRLVLVDDNSDLLGKKEAWKLLKKNNETLTDDDLIKATNRANEGLGLEGFDPVPRESSRNEVLLTDWMTGTVTYSNTRGEIESISSAQWAPFTASRFVRFLSTPRGRMPRTFGYADGTFASSLYHMCEEAGLSTLISDYVRPEDLSIMMPADSRGGGLEDKREGLRIVPAVPSGLRPDAGGESLDRIYGFSIKDMDVVIAGLRSRLDSLRVAILQDRELRESWVGEDAWSIGNLVSAIESATDEDKLWSTMFDLREHGGDPLPSPFRYIKRIIDSIEASYKGDYRRLMGGDRKFMDGGLSRHVAAVVYLGSVDSMQEVKDADLKERAPYITQHDMPQSTAVEPIPNIGKNAYLLPHQAERDYRHVKDPAKQVIAADAGGGKTIIGSIQRGLRTLAKGGKVLIVSPNNLMGNYVKDVTKITDGQVNVVPIDRELYQRYREDDNVSGLLRLVEGSPPNTIFLLGLNSLMSGEMTTFHYAGHTMKRSDVVELIRQVDWQMVIVDESHKIRNPQSTQYKSCVSLFRGVPQIVQMTGTYITDTILDIQKQGNLLETGAFGTVEQFENEFYRTVKNTKMVNTGAELAAFQKLEGVADVIQIRRTEWAAWLPKRKDKFEPCDDLSEAQRLAYRALFQVLVGYSDGADLEDLKGILPEQLLRTDTPKNDDEDMGDNEEEEDNKTVGYPLNNLERFLSTMDFELCLPQDLRRAVGSAAIKALRLKGADKISPKWTKIEELLNEHFADKDAGKVLIFTQWRDSAEGIYKYLEKKYRNSKGESRVMHYVAERQKVQIPLIQSQTSGKDIIVGVQKSLQEGHNFQVASMVIFVETPFTPGDMNQAESRILRPDPDGKYNKRGEVFFSVLLINDTVGMAKAAKLVAKRLSAARGNNRENPEYRAINKNFGNVKLSRKTLLNVATWDSVPPVPSLGKDEEGVESIEYFSLSQYLAYVGIDAPGNQPIKDSLIAIEEREMQRVRERGGDGRPVPIPSGGTIPGSRVMANVPYVSNMALPFEAELCLVNVAKWADEELNLTDKELTMDHFKGKYVHTEFGDGVVTRYKPGSPRTAARVDVVVNERGEDGRLLKVTADVSATFFIQDIECLNGKSVRVRMSELVGFELDGADPAILRSAKGLLDDDDEIVDGEFEDYDPDDEGFDPDDEEDEDGFDPEDDEGEDDELAPDANAPHGYVRDSDGYLTPIFKLKAEVVSVNGMFAILTHAQPDGAPQFDELTDTTAIIGSYMFADISSWAKYEAAFNALVDAQEESGIIELTQKSWDVLDDLESVFERSKDADRLVWNFRKAEAADRRKFFLESKRRKRGKALDVYPVVWRDAQADGDGGFTAKVRVFLMAHLDNQPRAANLARVPGRVRWRKDSTGFHISLFGSKDEAMADLVDLDSQDNIEITNLDEVRNSLEHVGIRRRRRRGGGR